MQDYRALVAGKITAKVFTAATLDEAQVAMLRHYGNTPDVCAMTELQAIKYLKAGYYQKTNARLENYHGT